jgi:hypothetical protein
MASVKQIQVTFDCAEPERVARFWCEVLGYVVPPPPEGKVVKNRLHLDVRVGTGLVGEERLAALEAECARLVALGAVRVRLLPADSDNESCLVMQDIEGNEFCLD